MRNFLKHSSIIYFKKSKILLVGISLFTFIVFNSEAQNHQLDSLKLEISKPQHDTTRLGIYIVAGEILYQEKPDSSIFLWKKAVEIAKLNLATNLSHGLFVFFNQGLSNSYNNIAFVYDFMGDQKKAIVFYQECLKLDKKINNQKGYATTLHNIGLLYDNQGEISLALKYYLRSLEIRNSIHDSMDIAYSYNNIANVYKNQGDDKKALDYHFKSLRIRESIKHIEGVAESYENISFIYERQGEQDKALTYYFKSMKLYESKFDDWGVSTCADQIGMIYFKQGKIPLALNYFERCFKICQKMKNKTGIATYFSHLGLVHKNEGNYILAISSYKKCLEILQEVNDLENVSRTFVDLAECYWLLNDQKTALNYSSQGMTIAQKLNFPDLIKNAAVQLRDIYLKLNDKSNALKNYQLYVQMKDSISGEDQKNQIKKQQFKFEWENRDAELKALQEKKNELDIKAKQAQNMILIFICLGFIAVVVLSVILYKRFKITTSQKKFIETQKKSVELAYEQLNHKNQEVLASIRYASKIQKALLPTDKWISKQLGCY